jgi:hypothetical protein
MRSRWIIRFVIPIGAMLSAVLAGGAWFRY